MKTEDFAVNSGCDRKSVNIRKQRFEKVAANSGLLLLVKRESRGQVRLRRRQNVQGH